MNTFLKQTNKGKYWNSKQAEEEKKENWDLLKKTMEALNLPVQEQEQIKKDILHKEAEYYRLK